MPHLQCYPILRTILARRVGSAHSLIRLIPNPWSLLLVLPPIRDAVPPGGVTWIRDRFARIFPIALAGCSPAASGIRKTDILEVS
ncbi:hypothetical protein SBA5_50064 [Candidatus Sulfotelmatomonas gaucii]|uniref:Uncharacterized protein n=1 Tax=Candidatus Sulfuritelmatomonas gaucii TaxID=2043161 RepID=A0A2N9LQU4_9BACT|nr:hypothetical protein SBA5_50064 [Candidatus Sulfotelmatomonas gaucii]